MRPISTGSVVQQAGLWCVLVLVVVLLTLLFTILGTITCAVLTGMMMAAVRHRRWQTIPVSLVFPGVVVALVQVAKVELVGPQHVLLPVLCFGAFWLMYLLTCGLVRLERKAEGNPAGNVPSTPARNAAPGAAQGSTNPCNLSAEPTAPAGELRLEALQGTWSSDTAESNGETQKRILEVVGNRLSLSVIDAQGRARLLAKGDVRLDHSAPARTRDATHPERPSHVPDGS